MDSDSRLHPRLHDDDDDETTVLISRPSSYSINMSADEESLAYPTRGPSGRSEYQGPFSDSADIDICREFEVYRSSAKYYLNQYLENLVQFCETPDATSTSQDLVKTGQNRILIRRKISRGSAIRDLNTMEVILAHAKNTPRSSERSISPTATTMWTVACSVSAWTVPVRVVAGISTVGAVAGVVYLTAPVAWYSLQEHNLDSARSKVRELMSRFEAGTVGDSDRYALQPSYFNFLKWSFVRR